MDNREDRKDISSNRKALYYGGLVLVVLGIILFLSVFVSGISMMNDPFSMPNQGSGFMVRGLIGFLMIFVGSILRSIGARGLAGSGVVLNPKQAREDLAPYTDALGGMAHDAVEGFKQAGGMKAQEIIKVRCPSCRALNEEQDKYCSQCGTAL